MANRFFIGQCALDIHLANCQSLKDKRRIIKSLKEVLKNRYNVAVCEFGDLSLWQRAELGIVTCGNDKTVVDAILKTIKDFLDNNHSISVVDFRIDVL